MLIAVGLAIAWASGCATSPTTIAPAANSTLDRTPFQVRMGTPIAALPTLIIAQDRGFFAQENLTVEMNAMGSSGLVNDALAAGQLDFGSTSPVVSILGTAKGTKTIMLCGLEYSFTDKDGKPWEAVYVVAREGEGIGKLADLRGKKVAVADIGSAYNYYLRAAMLEENVDPDKEMTIVPVPYAQMPGALTQKLVDAVVASADGYAELQKNGRVVLISTHTGLARLAMDVSSPLTVNTAFLQKNPDVVVRLLRAAIRARQWMAEDVAKNQGKTLVDSIARSMKYSPAIAQAFYDTRAGYYGKESDAVNLLDIPSRVVSRNIEVLKINGLIKQDTPADYSRYVDIRPLQRAYASLGLAWDESKH